MWERGDGRGVAPGRHGRGGGHGGAHGRSQGRGRRSALRMLGDLVLERFRRRDGVVERARDRRRRWGGGGHGDDRQAATIDWGDGAAVQAGTVNEANDTVTGSHVYANDGVYTLTVTVSDGRGGVDQGAGTVTVTNLPPAVSAGGADSGR